MRPFEEFKIEDNKVTIVEHFRGVGIIALALLVAFVFGIAMKVACLLDFYYMAGI